MEGEGSQGGLPEEKEVDSFPKPKPQRKKKKNVPVRKRLKPLKRHKPHLATTTRPQVSFSHVGLYPNPAVCVPLSLGI